MNPARDPFVNAIEPTPPADAQHADPPPLEAVVAAVTAPPDGALRAAPKSTRYFRMVVGLVIAGVIFAYILYAYVPLAEIVDALKKAAPPWIALAAVTSVANRVLMTLKWWTLLRSQGVRVGLASLTATQFTSYFIGRALPGSAGVDIVRTWIVARERGGAAVIITSVLVDRVTSVVALALVSLIALVALGVEIQYENIVVVGAAGVCVLFVVMLVSAGPMDQRLSRWKLDHAPRLGRILSAVRRVLESVNHYRRRPGVMATAILWGMAVQATRCLEIYLLFVALGEPGLLYACFAIVPVVMFITQVPLGISSMAVGAGAMVLFFEQFGVPSSASLLASVLADAMCLVILPVGAVCYWFRGVPVVRADSSASG